MEDDLINGMKELIRCYEYCHNNDSPTNQEILMWRKKFLENSNPGMKASNTFLSISSSLMLKHTPQEHLERIQKYNEN